MWKTGRPRSSRGVLRLEPVENFVLPSKYASEEN